VKLKSDKLVWLFLSAWIITSAIYMIFNFLSNLFYAILTGICIILIILFADGEKKEVQETKEEKLQEQISYENSKPEDHI